VTEGEKREEIPQLTFSHERKEGKRKKRGEGRSSPAPKGGRSALGLSPGERGRTVPLTKKEPTGPRQAEKKMYQAPSLSVRDRSEKKSRRRRLS